jgi:L-asparaginase II
MARFAVAQETDARGHAMVRLRNAMTRHPKLVAGEGRACTELMRTMAGRVAIKTGAEGVFVGIVPEKRLGIAVKIVDGATRAAELAIAALLVHLGVLDHDHPATRKHLDAVQPSWRGLEAGIFRAAPGFPG